MADAGLTVALVGVGGTLAGALLGNASSLIQARSARQAEERRWKRDKRYEVYTQIIQDAQLRIDHFDEYKELSFYLAPDQIKVADRPILPSGSLPALTAKLRLIGEKPVQEAWAKYVSEIDVFQWEVHMVDGPDASSDDLRQAAEQLIKATSTWMNA